MEAKAMANKTNKARNLLHNHPMMKKGGVHQKSNKAQRKKEKTALRKAWFSPSAALSAVFGEDRARIDLIHC